MKSAYGIIALSMLWVAICLQPVETIKVETIKVKERSSVTEKIKRHCKDEYIAEVLGKSKRPFLYAAIASVESDYRPQITGDKGMSKGMFQIQPQHHGEVPDRLLQQLRKSESILEPLIEKHGLQKGIARYNGKGRKARIYSAKVRKRYKQIIEG